MAAAAGPVSAPRVRAKTPTPAPPSRETQRPALQPFRSYPPPGEADRIPVHPVETGGPALQLQRKLAIGSTSDPLEAEADRVAERILRQESVELQTSGGTERLRRKCACEQSGKPCATCSARKKDDEEREGLLQRAATSSATEQHAPQIVHDVLREPGRPLDPVTRAFMEPRFGRDFSHVRVHDDPYAADSARQVHAHAYAVGSHLVFAQGKYQPNSRQGLRLVAHELAHVVQQNVAPIALRREPEDHPEYSNSIIGRAYRKADEKRWEEVAELINGLSPHDLKVFLFDFQKKPDQISSIYLGAIGNKNVGPDSQVAKATRYTHLDFKFNDSAKHGQWYAAAEYLNAFNRDDAMKRLKPLGTDDLRTMHDAAVRNPGLGSDSGVAKFTAEVLASRASSGDTAAAAPLADTQHKLTLEEKKAHCAAGNPENTMIFPLRLPKGIFRIDVAPITARREGKNIRVSQPVNAVFANKFFRREVKTLPLQTFTGGILLAPDEVVRVRVYDDEEKIRCVTGEQMLKISEATDTATLLSIVDTAFLAATIIAPGAGAGRTAVTRLAFAGIMSHELGEVVQQGQMVEAGLQDTIDWAGIIFDTFIQLITLRFGSVLSEAGVTKLLGTEAAQYGRPALKFAVEAAMSGAIAGFQGVAKALFDLLRKKNEKMTIGQFIEELAVQFTMGVFFHTVSAAAADHAGAAGPHVGAEDSPPEHGAGKTGRKSTSNPQPKGQVAGLPDGPPLLPSKKGPPPIQKLQPSEVSIAVPPEQNAMTGKGGGKGGLNSPGKGKATHADHPPVTSDEPQAAAPKPSANTKPDMRPLHKHYTTEDKARGLRFDVSEGPLGVPGKVQEHRSDSAQSRVSAGTGDDAGHRIGNIFGGAGGEENLALQNYKANEFGTFKKLENYFSRKLKAGTGIDVKVTDVTRAGEDRPYHRKVRWTETSPTGEVSDHELDFVNTHTAKSRQMQKVSPTVSTEQTNNVIKGPWKSPPPKTKKPSTPPEQKSNLPGGKTPAKAHAEPEEIPWLDDVGMAEIQLDRAQAYKSFVDWITLDTTREVGIYMDPHTGEYIVVQGNQGSVGLKDVMSEKSMERHWIPVEHFHPGGEDLARLASPADFHAMMNLQLAGVAPHGPVSSRIRWIDPITGAHQVTEIGFRPNSREPYYIKFKELNGTVVEKTFKVDPWAKGSDYEQWVVSRGAAITHKATPPPPPSDADTDPAIHIEVDDSDIVDVTPSQEALKKKKPEAPALKGSPLKGATKKEIDKAVDDIKPAGEMQTLFQWKQRDAAKKQMKTNPKLLYGWGQPAGAKPRTKGKPQAAHAAPRSAMRGVKGYKPEEAFTNFIEHDPHFSMDAGWKAEFRAMVAKGKTTATAQEIFDIVKRSIEKSTALSQGAKQSEIERLKVEMFMELGLDPGDVLKVPYAK